MPKRCRPKSLERGLLAPAPAPAPASMSAVGQNQPLKVEIRGFKTSHFLEQKTAPRDCPDAGPMEHVELPKSELASNYLQFKRPRLVPTADRTRAWNRSRDRRPIFAVSKPAISTTGLEEAGEAKPAISTAGNGVGRKSQCEPLAEVILAKAEGGLSAQRIYQDLVGENGFTDSYQSVKRFVRKLRAAQPERI